MYYSIFSEQENIMNLYSMQEDFVSFHLSFAFPFKIYNYDKKNESNGNFYCQCKQSNVIEVRNI